MFDDDPDIVAVHTWLRVDTHRAFTAHAALRGTSVEALLSALADAAVPAPPAPVSARQYTRITITMVVAARTRMSHGESLTAIAESYGCSRFGLRKALTRGRTP